MPEDPRDQEEPTYGEESGQRPHYGPGSGGDEPAEQGTDTGLPNDDLHGQAREVEESANKGPADTPGGG